MVRMGKDVMVVDSFFQDHLVEYMNIDLLLLSEDMVNMVLVEKEFIQALVI